MQFPAQFRSQRSRAFVVWLLGLLAVSGLLALGETPSVASRHGHSSAAKRQDLRDDVNVSTSPQSSSFNRLIAQHTEDLINDGRQIFRLDTFGDEAFFGDLLQLHKAILGQAHGGVGSGISPKTALAVGLKVDSQSLPKHILQGIANGTVSLDDPASTLVLLQHTAVVGLQGKFDKGGNLLSVGISCALCHSTVDDSVAPGIGRRLDGWANRDLNVGAILALAPNLQPVADLLHTDVTGVKKVLNAWGPGKFDAELFLDGKGFRPDGKTAAVLIPDAFGLAGVNLHTYTGWGSVTYWNAFVANLEMHGKGTFFDPRLDDGNKFPIAAQNKFGHRFTPEDDDQITSKLASLHFYQLAIPAPPPKKGSFDTAAAARGDQLFSGKGKCATCHVPPLYTEPGWNMHTASEIGIDDFQAKRSPDQRYRTTPLRGIWTRTRGGFYHDGRFATLLQVVDHYNTTMSLGLSAGEERDIVEYMKSLGDEVPAK